MSTSISDAKVSRCGAKPVGANSLPCGNDALVQEFAPDPQQHDALRAWLDFGVRLGELREHADAYALRSWLARRLAAPDHDAVAALAPGSGRRAQPSPGPGPGVLRIHCGNHAECALVSRVSPSTTGTWGANRRIGLAFPPDTNRRIRFIEDGSRV
jgi:hypothetical protein